MSFLALVSQDRVFIKIYKNSKIKLLIFCQQWLKYIFFQNIDFHKNAPVGIKI